MSRSAVLGWHSGDQLHRRAEMKEFVEILEQNIAAVVRSYKLDPAQAEVELASCWALVNGKLASGVVHCHPN